MEFDIEVAPPNLVITGDTATFLYIDANIARHIRREIMRHLFGQDVKDMHPSLLIQIVEKQFNATLNKDILIPGLMRLIPSIPVLDSSSGSDSEVVLLKKLRDLFYDLVKANHPGRLDSIDHFYTASSNIFNRSQTIVLVKLHRHYYDLLMFLLKQKLYDPSICDRAIIGPESINLYDQHYIVFVVNGEEEWKQIREVLRLSSTRDVEVVYTEQVPLF